MKFHTNLLSIAVLSALAVPAMAANNVASTAGKAAALKAQTLSSPALARAGSDAFVAGRVNKSSNGTEHARLARTYKGLPVLGGDVIMHTSRNGQVRVTSTLKSTQRPVNTNPNVSKAEAIVNAGAHLKSTISVMPQGELVVYARKEFAKAPILAWKVDFKGFNPDGTEADQTFIVNAATGAIARQWSNIHNAFKPGPDAACPSGTAAVGTGKTVRLGNVTIDTSKCGNVYKMVDRVRGMGTTNNMAQRTSGKGVTFADTDNIWGNNSVTDSASAGAEAHYGVATTWDYFKQVHDRNGIADDGKGATSLVHYGRNYFNAGWSDASFTMIFGDGNPAISYPLTVLDVAGHEMAHGVTSRSANLEYSGESGGLNEATSDIFGSMVEYFANNPEDKGDYLIGERIYKANDNLPAGKMPVALRYMFKPILDTDSPDCYSSSIGGIDVHYSSGVANHFYYLLAEGSVVPAGFGTGTEANLTPADLVCAGPSNLAGIGRDKADKIWYAALTDYMTTDTDYAGARAATLSAATDLYGATSAEYKAVAAAWTAVSVN